MQKRLESFITKDTVVKAVKFVEKLYEEIGVLFSKNEEIMAKLTVERIYIEGTVF